MTEELKEKLIGFAITFCIMAISGLLAFTASTKFCCNPTTGIYYSLGIWANIGSVLIGLLGFVYFIKVLFNIKELPGL